MTERIQKKLPPLIFLLSLGFYLYTLAPVVTFVDSGELAAVIGTRGVSHPPGFPLYLLLGSLVAVIPAGTLIWRLNAFSALCGAISVALTYKIFFQISKSSAAAIPKTVKKHAKGKRKNKIISKPIPMIDLPWVGASAAAFAWMTNRALWNAATVTEVYALHALLITLICFLSVSYSRNPEPVSTRYLALVSLIAGLGLSNYPPFGLLAPAVLFYIYRVEKRSMRRKWTKNLWMLALVAFGLIPYVLLPIRAHSDPLLNWGNPSTWELFWKHISAAQYKVFLGSPNFALLSNAFSLWWDQWPAAVWLLILPGIVFLWRFRSDEFYLMFIIGMMNILYVLSYDIIDVASAPSDYYAYLLPLCWVSSIWIGSGVQWIFLTARGFLPHRSLSIATAVILIVAIPIATAATFWKNSNRHNYFHADDFARSMLGSLSPDALVLSDDWTFVSPALYLQYVENIRPDVVVLDTELLRRSWYLRYVEKRAPWLAQANQEDIRDFLKEVVKFEADRPYDREFITQKYVAMINNFISTALRLDHPPHILLNLQAKEADPGTYRKLERILGRPPFITAGVMPNAIGELYQWVPENLAFRLYADGGLHTFPPITVPPRNLDWSREYDPITRGVIARYAEFWRWRGDYLKFHEDCPKAMESYERALQITPDLAEANEGLSECVQKLLERTKPETH